MVDPRRPWRTLEWRRIVDYYHACQYVQQLAEAIFSAGREAQNWAKEMRHVLQRESRRRQSGVEIGLWIAAWTRLVWHGQSLRSSVWLPEKTPSMDAVSQLSAPEITDWIRHYGSGL